MAHIEFRNVSIDFPIYNASGRSLKKRLMQVATGGQLGADEQGRVVVRALENLNFSVNEGDRVALIGHNGAGKSTLLRLLSGIYEPTHGSAVVSGRVAPVFDLGVGMDPEISGYENIMIRGLFLGMTRKQMEARVDDIADFTALGGLLRRPL